jgi:hypothetical protein
MANIKISELNPLLTVEDADVLPIVDNAVTKKVTAAILRSYTQGNSVLLTGAQTIAGIKTFTSQLASSVATGTAPFSVASTTKVTNLNADLLDGLSSADFQATLSGTGIVKSTAGTISYLTDNSTNWNTAFNDSITSAAVTGTTTKTLTLNQQDGGTITASWSDINTDAVSSVFGRTGAVVATEGDYSLTQLSDVTLSSPSNGQVLKYNGTAWINGTDTDTGLTSVGLSMPSAFTVSNSPLTSNGTLAVTGAGVASQYVRGDGTLAPFPTSSGGGSSVSYYFNGGTNQGTIGGNTYYEMSKDAVIGVGADFTINSNGYISQFLTDANDPAALTIPGGNWNFEMWFSANSNGGSPSFYLELYKYDGSTLTLISSGSATPELITNGTVINLYTTALAVPTTALTITDRLAVRVFVNNSGKTITLHTQNGHLCQAITTFSTGLTALNGLTAQVQNFAVGTSGTDFGISSATSTHTFNLPTASATNRGALSSADWTIFNNKQNALTNPITGTGTTNYLPKFTGASALGNSILQEATNVIALGSTPSTWSLGKAFEINSNGNGLWSYSNDNVYLNQNAYFNSDWKYGSTGTAAQYIQFQGAHIWNTAPSGSANATISFTETMRITSAGNVGIGTSTPARKLSVSTTSNGIPLRLETDGSNTGIELIGGNTLFNFFVGKQYNVSNAFEITPSTIAGGTTFSTPALSIQHTGAATFSSSVTAGSLISTKDNAAYDAAFIEGANGIAYLGALGTASDIQLYNGGSTKVTIKPISGNVGIGTTTPATKFHIQDTNGGIFFDGSGATYNRFKSTTSSASTGRDLLFSAQNAGTTPDLYITSSGNVLIGTTTDSGYKLDVNGTSRFSGAVQTRNLQIAGASGGYTTGDNPMLGFGNAPVTNDFGTIEAPFGDKMVFNQYHGYKFKVSNNGSSPVDALVINIDRSATFASSVTIGNFTTTQINALTPATGMVVFNTTLATLCFYDGSGWRKVSHSSM